MPINKANVARLKAHLLEEPRRFFMEGFGYSELLMDDKSIACPDGFFACFRDDLPFEFEEPPCGTAGCICGWANMLQNADRGLAGKDLFRDLADTIRARHWLGLDADDPFYLMHWPAEFSYRYRHAQTAQERAQTAADYLDTLCAQEDAEPPTEGD